MLNTTLCYIRRGDDYLMLHRIKKKNDLNQDKWIGIGGKFEDKESPEDCRWPTEYMHLFTADGFTGELKECDEGVLEWIPRDRLLEIPHWEGDAIFLDLIAREDQPFFSLKLCYEGDTLVEAVLDGRHIKGGSAP